MRCYVCSSVIIMRLKLNICLLLQVLWTVLIIVAWSQNAQVQACTTGWFGSNCQYSCHCNNNNCGADGACRDGVCKSGWFGPGCQYVDLVYSKAASNIPHWLYGGGSNYCNDGHTIQPVKIDLTSAFPFTWLRLQVKDPSLLHQFQIMFSNRTNEGSFSCVKMRNATVNDKTLDVYCDIDVTVRYVILTGEGVKFLCSLYISGGRNVALRQNTSQSSTYSSKWDKRELSIAENAVDGNTNNNWAAGSCTSTNDTRTDKSPTWNVTFSQKQMINRYVLYNRDNNMERLKGFTLTSFTNDLMVVLNYTDRKTGDPLRVYTLTSMDKTRPIAVVKIQAKNVLTLCEVELYGDSVCEPSIYGRECEHKCNCAVKNEACFVSTGGCPSGCSAGFQGESCNQHCDYGKYGEECSSNCSQFCMVTNGSGSPCHPIDGACRHGCQSGYQVPHCDHLIMDDNSFPVAVIAGLLIAVVALVIVATLCVILWRRRAAAKHKNMSAAVSNDGTNLNQNGRVTFRELESTNSYTRSDHKENQQAKQVTNDKQNKNDLKTKTHFTDEVYYNVISAASSTSISVRDLSDFMASHDKAFFQKQFNAIPANTNATTTAGMSEENKHKNRYKNICAYDHSRVVLKINKEKTHGDYINASYIEGYKGQQKFIASQGPTKEILEDFVRMLSEQGIEVVVMLTNLTEDGKMKCERYWPDDDEIQTGDFKIKLTTTQVFADYTIRRLQLLQEGQPVQTLTQFHFTSWPDKDVPTTAWSLVDFEQRVASISTDKPIVVHCSAGVGRTGTFIALYNVLRQAMDTGYVDFFTAVQKLRHDRVLMVQTPDQYEFLHRAAQVAVACMGTTIMSSNITERVKVDKSELEKEFNTVCSISDDNTDYSGDEKNMVHISSAYENSQTLSNKLKNRFQNVLAKEDYRVILIGGNEGDSGNYINAVFMPSFSKKNQQILTQLPLPTTVVDFWRMVTQYKVTLVVALEVDLMPADSSIGNYFPRNENEEVYEKSFKIKSQQISPAEFWNEQKLVITMDSNKSTTVPASSIPEREHHLIHMTCKDSPANLQPLDLLALMKAVRSHTPSGGGRTVYMCRNGAEYSGLVCVLSLLLDRLDNDHRLTVPLVVGAIKAIRPQVIPTVHQYELLYQVLRLYNDSNNVYSNF